MSRPLAYDPQQGYMYQILVRNVEYDRQYDHLDYAVDRADRKMLMENYRLVYRGQGAEFKIITLPKKYWSKVRVLGFYVDKGGNKNNPQDVFVAIDEQGTNDPNSVMLYCPIGQHHSGSRDYLKECKKINKEQYLKASQGYFTPSDYLE